MARSNRARITMAVCVALAVPLVFACNTIIGLSDFEKGECPGLRCADGGGGPADGGPDVFADATPDVRGASPVSWAQWIMPNYDGGADLLPNKPVYNVIDNDVIEDKVTGLVWRRATLASQPLAAEEAKVACAALAGGPWRLPKRIEVVSLLDFGRTGTGILIDPRFAGVKNVKVWTSSEVRPFTGSPAQYWTVSFETGAVEPLGAELVTNVLCVKGTP